MSAHFYEVTDVFVPHRGTQIDRITPQGREPAVYFWGHKTDAALSKAMATKLAASANAVLQAPKTSGGQYAARFR